MAYLIPADKGTHFVLAALITLAALNLGWPVAVAACASAAVGRELYGRWRRARPMTRQDWVESARDIGATLAGGAVVLVGGYIGI